MPGVDEEAVNGGGQVLRGGGPGFPIGPMAFSGPFPQDLPEQRSPWDPLWKKGGSHK